jgi:hypothetical protein
MGIELDLTDPRPKAPKPKGKVEPVKWSMAMMTADGYMCGLTEKWNPHAVAPGSGSPGIRQDLFGFIDFLAVGDDRIIGVQCCAHSGLGSHRTKMAIDKYTEVKTWLQGGRGDIQLHGWQRIEEATQEGTKYRTKYKRVGTVENIDMRDIERIRDAYFQKMPPPLSEGNPF